MIAAIVAAPLSGHLASVAAGDVTGQSPPATKGARPVERALQRLTVRSLKQCVADAKVIVVGTAVDSTAAPPNVAGDLPENFIWFRVHRVFKGQLTAVWIVTRTPTAAKDFIGRDWVIMLSPEYIEGKHFYAGCHWIKAEPEVRAILKASEANPVKASGPSK
jgi:hypothetical protein